MKKTFRNLYLNPIIAIFLLIPNACAKESQPDDIRSRTAESPPLPTASDYIQMKVKEITCRDKNNVLTLEFSNRSSEVCEFGNSPASLEYTGSVKILKGLYLSGGTGTGNWDKYKKGIKLFTVLPKQTITVQIPLSGYIESTSASKSILYIFTHMRIGESASPQYKIYELTAPCTPKIGK